MGSSKERRRISLWINVTAGDAIRAEATRRKLPVAEVFREVLSIGWRHYRDGERRSGRNLQ